MQKVLYCGDTSLDSAAAYLTGLMTAWDWPFEYVASNQVLAGDERLTSGDLADCGLVVLSDYPAARMDAAFQAALVQRVSDGCGLIMLGGWESFHGLGGDWDGTTVATALPVIMAASDDRVNCDGPVLPRPTTARFTDEHGNAPHPILAGLPWSERPPLIGGFNRFAPADGAEVLLEAVRLQARAEDGAFVFEESGSDPLLVVGRYGQGRTAALATDVAPHWIGPMVDWGPDRVTARAQGTEGIEVGNLYARFFRQLLTWAAR